MCTGKFEHHSFQGGALTRTVPFSTCMTTVFDIDTTGVAHLSVTCVSRAIDTVNLSSREPSS